MFSDVHIIVFKTELINTIGDTKCNSYTTNNQQSLDLFFFFFAIISKTFLFQPLREDLIEKKGPAIIGTESSTFPRT